AAAPLWTDELAECRKLQQHARGALDQLRRSGQRYVSLVDADARLLRRSGGGHLTGYNAQAVAVRAGASESESALMLVAAEVTQSQVDSGELPRMVDAAHENGEAEMTVADAGYFTADSLAAMRERGMPIAMPEPRPFEDHPFHWRHFRYDRVRDEYTCPEGERLVFRQVKYTRRTPARLYGAEPEVCRACRQFGICTTSEFHGRTITVSEQSQALEAHRRWMRSRQAEDALRKRPALIEPVFAVIKERQAGRRFLLRGLEAVQAEWSLLAVAFNLRALSRYWLRLMRLLDSQGEFAAAPG
ncbi:MAG: transposase, partial [Chloroflexi bacterium]|nr:transposase [Chloroflexota bacterium]